MAADVAEERFDWKGPAAYKRRIPLLRKLTRVVVPPKGHKVVPTGSGMLLIFIGLTIGLAAYNTVNNVLFAALALLISALILSGVICWGNMLCARWRLEASPTFRVGEEGSVSIVLENARRRFPLFCVSFEISSGGLEDHCKLFMRERLDPGESTALTWRFKPSKRMKTAFRIESAVSSFPFGFLVKYLPGESEREVRIWPRRIAYTRNRSQESVGAKEGKSSRKQGISGELIGLRHYERGDSLRSIHWKVSAKQGRLIVKENATETQPIFDIVVDPANYLWSDETHFEKMCSMAASMSEDLFLEGKIAHCHVKGWGSIRIQRVSDLEAFFDILSELNPVEPQATWDVLAGPNRINFAPLQGDGVGAFVNDVQVAQS
ncbi:DUF58 domain-containing protein [Pelagicoccus albus]|uniref:DUF58 domain-containing protein n=1 Tax=Pelagicoccus albus TaxID=415222 RepID=A0A7X1B778_9BACT|nr:DUF58 domain-containing protein [Pelagicoccus albus]MBC2605670.1 DUF58 domain-containing protein [Pelagicoccus albus]